MLGPTGDRRSLRTVSQPFSTENEARLAAAELLRMQPHARYYLASVNYRVEVEEPTPPVKYIPLRQM